MKKISPTENYCFPFVIIFFLFSKFHSPYKYRLQADNSSQGASTNGNWLSEHFFIHSFTCNDRSSNYKMFLLLVNENHKKWDYHKTSQSLSWNNAIWSKVISRQFNYIKTYVKNNRQLLWFHWDLQGGL